MSKLTLAQIADKIVELRAKVTPNTLADLTRSRIVLDGVIAWCREGNEEKVKSYIREYLKYFADPRIINQDLFVFFFEQGLFPQHVSTVNYFGLKHCLEVVNAEENKPAFSLHPYQKPVVAISCQNNQSSELT